jgi:hypothetical protein
MMQDRRESFGEVVARSAVQLDAIAVLARDHAGCAADVGRQGAMNPVGRAGEGADIDDND